MSDLTPQKHYNKLIEDGEAFDFTKLTSTGISSNYEKVFEFAESYFKARNQANEDSKQPEKALAIQGVGNRFLTITEALGYLNRSGHTFKERIMLSDETIILIANEIFENQQLS